MATSIRNEYILCVGVNYNVVLTECEFQTKVDQHFYMFKTNVRLAANLQGGGRGHG